MIKRLGVQLHDQFNDQALLEIFLAPTRLYVKPVLKLRKYIDIKAINRITGGGFYENTPYILPEGLSVKINAQSFLTLEVFNWL